jgi:hypothetical protein
MGEEEEAIPGSGQGKGRGQLPRRNLVFTCGRLCQVYPEHPPPSACWQIGAQRPILDHRDPLQQRRRSAGHLDFWGLA